MACRMMPNIYVITNEFEASTAQPSVFFNRRIQYYPSVLKIFARRIFLFDFFFLCSLSKDNIYIEYCAIATREHATFAHKQ